jgi:hypothetical protein
MAGGAGTLFVSAVNDWAPRDSDRNETSMPGFPLAERAGIMRRVREYPVGTQLFTKPVSRLEGGGRLAVRGAPWPVEVWYAPPTVPASRLLGVDTL